MSATATQPHEHFIADREPRVIFGMVNADGSPVLWYYDEERWETITKIQVMKHRIRVNMATSGTDMAAMDARAVQRALCARPGADGLIYWLATFGWILEPRNEGVLAKLPFIPFPRQLDLIDWIYWVMDQPLGANSSGLVEKSRSVGATWLSAAHTAKHWQFDPHMWVSGVISKTDELVDNKGDPASYFWKVDFLLKNQPEWLLPDGFAGFHERSPHRSHAKLLNPATDSVVVGSTTTDLSFVGARLKKLDIDEAGTLEGFDEIWSNTATVTDHRFAITTPRTRHTMGVYNLRFGLEGYVTPAIFSFRWNEVPGRDEYWFASMRETMQADRFKREIQLDWKSDQGEFVYPNADPIRPSDEYGFVPGWPVIVGIDDGWDDEFAITWMQKDLARSRYRILGGYSNRGKPIKFYGHILTGNPDSPDFEFDWAELELMRWVKSCGLYKAIFYGDRHGDNTDLSSGKSPFKVLLEQTGIFVITNPDPRHNDIQYRIDATSEAIPRIDCHTEHNAPTVLHALQNARYPRRRETAQPTGEVRGPIHDGSSHYRTTVEYIMINDRMASVAPRPVRRNAGWHERSVSQGPRRSGSQPMWGSR